MTGGDELSPPGTVEGNPTGPLKLCPPLWRVVEGKVAEERGPYGVHLGQQIIPVLAAPYAEAEGDMVPETQLPAFKVLARGFLCWVLPRGAGA